MAADKTELFICRHMTHVYVYISMVIGLIIH